MDSLVLLCAGGGDVREMYEACWFQGVGLEW